MTIQEHLSQTEPALYYGIAGVLQDTPPTHTRSNMAVTVWTREYQDWDMSALSTSLSRWLETGDYHETRTEDLA